MVNLVSSVELKPGTNEELLPNFEEKFPCIRSHVVFGKGYQAPWHWHKAVELFYIQKGTLEYITPSQSHVFPAGTVGMVNSNVLHMAVGHQNEEQGTSYLHLFDPVVISGFSGNSIDEKYVLPLVTAPNVELMAIEPGVETYDFVLSAVEKSFQMDATMPGYELYLRGVLSEIWMEFFKVMAPQILEQEHGSGASEMTKQMLVYIHEHYGERLTVQKIAQAASVSERSCYELFRRNLRTTPMEYVNSYRIRVACQRLTQTEQSVMDISAECGMNNSYFSQVFREATGFKPLEYRRFYQRHQHSLQEIRRI